MREPLRAPTAAEIDEARKRIAGAAIRTPLVRLDVDLPFELWLKLENLQPIGSFKIRGALNAIRALPADRVSRGVWTASAGNMAQGLAWGARELGVPCTVLAPDRAPRTKLEAIERLGARTITVSFERWWQAMVEHRYEGIDGEFIHPVANQQVITGNATGGVEILEDLRSPPDAVLVPYGGGGQSVGIASAFRARGVAAKVYACEVDTAAPLHASLAAGKPLAIDHKSSWVDGISGRSVLEEMWPLASSLLAGSLVSSLAQIAAAVRLLVTRARVVAEGAGAAPVS
ncbi:MAG TPA: pyridoxal-phosphate dependent enzyme, partial [Gemmatimonadaceae bacterium]